MRHRRWVVVLAVLIIGVLPLSFLGLEVASRHPVVKRAVLSRIMPVVAGELAVGELEMGLASLQFTDISLELENGGLVLIPSASINLSYAELLLGGLVPERSLSSVIVSSPRIVVNYGAPGDTVKGDQVPFDVASLEAYLPEYLGISDATVVFRDVRTGRVLTIDSIDFLLERAGDGPVAGGAVGSCLGGSGNLQAEFVWDGSIRELSVSGELVSARLGEGLPVPPAIPVGLTAGSMDASFHASVSPDSIVGLELEFETQDATLVAEAVGEKLSGINARGRIAHNVLSIDEAAGVWRQAPWSARGSLALATGGIDSLSISAQSVSVGPVVALLGEETGPVGTVDVSLDVRGTLDSPWAVASLRSGNLRAGGLSIDDLSGRLYVSADSISVVEASASVLGGEVRAEGGFSRAARDSSWRFRVFGGATRIGVGELTAFALGDTAGVGTVTLTDVIGRGSLNDPYLESLVSWDGVILGPMSLGSGAGEVLLGDGTLSASLQAANRSYAVSGVIDDVYGSPNVTAELDLRALALDSLFSEGSGPVFPVEVEGTIAASGPVDSLSVEGWMAASAPEFSATAGLDGEVLLSQGSTPELSLSVVSPDAEFRGVALPFDARLSVDGEVLSLSDVTVGDFCRAGMSVALTPERALRGGVVVSEANLSEVLKALLGEAPEGVEGLVFSSVSLQGTASRPVGSAQVQVGNARVLGVQGLDAAAVATFGGGAVELKELEVRESGRPFVTASGAMSPEGDIEVTVSGEGVPGPFLGGGDDTRFDATVGIGGVVGDPALDGFVRARDGHFLGILFEEFSARITGADGVVTVDPLVMERSSVFRATAAASVPYAALGDGADVEGTLSVEVTGNPMALIAELAGATTEGSGRGTMNAVLVGNGRALSVADARLEARVDHLVPQGLFERIDDVEVSLAIRDGAVVSGEIEGRVAGSLIGLRSERGLTVDGRDLEPIVMGGVDCGVLALSTDDRGVMANVPGLMLPDERGRVAVRGRDGSPYLLASGPSDLPLIWGELEFSDLSFTYPLIESEEEGPIGSLLSDAEWSLRMTAGRNLWYWRPDANLNVERGSALEFVGVPSEHTMCVSGDVASNRGTVTYLHTDFDVREVFVGFPAFCEPPMFRIEAETRVADGTAISLSMQTTDDAAMLSAQGVTLDESELVLSSDSPDDNTPERIMARLQYGMSSDLMEAEEQAALERRRAVELIGTQIGLRVARPLLAPIEARIRRGLNLDLVRIDIDFVEHFLAQMDMWSAQEGTAEYVPFVADTRMTLGKYISRDWLLSYLGVVEPFEAEVGEQVLGLRSELGIEYEVSRNTSLSLRVVYDPSLAGWDRRISIENRYEF